MPLDHKAFIGLSNWNRSFDLTPMRLFCSNKTILDLGCHYGITSFDALQNGAKKVVAIDSDPECIKAAKQILGEDKSTVIEHDLTIASSLKNLGFSKNEFNTIFYLAIHQHLAHRKPGSEENMLNEIIDLNPEYIIFRAKGFTEKISQTLTKKFGDMCFYAHTDKRLGPMIGYKNRNN